MSFPFSGITHCLSFVIDHGNKKYNHENKKYNNHRNQKYNNGNRKYNHENQKYSIGNKKYIHRSNAHVNVNPDMLKEKYHGNK